MNVSNSSASSQSAASPAGFHAPAARQAAAVQAPAIGQPFPAAAPAVPVAVGRPGRLMGNPFNALNENLVRSLARVRNTEIPSADAFLDLGSAMTAFDSVGVLGVPMTQQDCYYRALQLDPQSGRAYLLLGNTIGPGRSIVINGEEMTREQCHLRAQQLNQ